MHFIERGQNVILWGAGKVGSQAVKKLSDFCNIKFIVDNRIQTNKIGQIYNISVYNPDILKQRELWKDSILILSLDRWEELKEELNTFGLRIFKDFIPWFLLDYSYNEISIECLEFLNTDREKEYCMRKLANGKKICALYGECHTNIYKYFLSNSKEFLEQYIILNIPFVQCVEDKYHYILNKDYIWASCDLLIANLIYPNNPYGAPSTRAVLEKTKNTCKKILVTDAAFKGYFPQNTMAITQTKEYFAWGDKNINKMIKQGLSTEDIEEKVLGEEFYDQKFVDFFFEKSLEILALQEKECDIKIFDYIQEKGKTKILYQNWTHPGKEVMLELGRRIFSLLNLDGSILGELDDDSILDIVSHGELIYPSVLKALGLINTDTINRKINPCRGRNKSMLTSKEYIEKYVLINSEYLI